MKINLQMSLEEAEALFHVMNDASGVDPHIMAIYYRLGLLIKSVKKAREEN